MTSKIVFETPTLTHQIDASAACAAANTFLLDHMGNQLVAGSPHLMVSAVRAVWIVPVQLAYIHTDTLGSVGVIAVDEETGQVVAWTLIPQMKDASRRLRESQTPDVSEQFRSFMAAQPQAESQWKLSTPQPGLFASLTQLPTNWAPRVVAQSL